MPWEGVAYMTFCRGREYWSTVLTLVLVFAIACKRSQINSEVLSSLCISRWETLVYLQLASRSCCNLGLWSSFVRKLAYRNSVPIRSKYTSTQTLTSLVSIKQNNKKVWKESSKQDDWRTFLGLPAWASLRLEIAAPGPSQHFFAS